MYIMAILQPIKEGVYEEISYIHMYNAIVNIDSM